MNMITRQVPASTEMLRLPRFVRKRSRELADFNRDKIYNAIAKAAEACHVTTVDLKNTTSRVCARIVRSQFANQYPSVEEVQDIVEDVLLSTNPKMAQAYIRYRAMRTESRHSNSHMIFNIVEGYVDDSDWRTRENSNMSRSVQGLKNHISGELEKHYALEKFYEGPIADAHRSGALHIHDLSMLASYCVGWDLKNFLTDGFTGVKGKINCKPPTHFDTACNQIVQFLYTTQGETSGAQALSNFDTYMAPFIRYDGMTYREVVKAMRSFVFSLNVPTRVG